MHVCELRESQKKSSMTSPMDERHRKIQFRAWLIAEASGHTRPPVSCWLEAETAVDNEHFDDLVSRLCGLPAVWASEDGKSGMDHRGEYRQVLCVAVAPALYDEVFNQPHGLRGCGYRPQLANPDVLRERAQRLCIALVQVARARANLPTCRATAALVGNDELNRYFKVHEGGYNTSVEYNGVRYERGGARTSTKTRHFKERHLSRGSVKIGTLEWHFFKRTFGHIRSVTATAST